MAKIIKSGGSTIRWMGDEAQKDIGRTAKQKLKLAAEVTANQVKRNISTGRPASSPGNFPHVDTGRLRNSIFWNMTSNTQAIVGTPVKYGLYLEVGTSKMAARPFLRPTLDQMRGKIERIFKG